MVWENFETHNFKMLVVAKHYQDYEDFFIRNIMTKDPIWNDEDFISVFRIIKDILSWEMENWMQQDSSKRENKMEGSATS